MCHEIIVAPDQLASNEKLSTPFTLYNLRSALYIGVALITQFTQVCNKNSNTQGSSPYVVKVIFHTLMN